MIEIGKTYKTYGEWDALPIWKNFSTDGNEPSYIVIHKPKTEDEQYALCDADGIAQSIFAINEPPTYNMHHPADLMLD